MDSTINNYRVLCYAWVQDGTILGVGTSRGFLLYHLSEKDDQMCFTPTSYHVIGDEVGMLSLCSNSDVAYVVTLSQRDVLKSVNLNGRESDNVISDSSTASLDLAAYPCPKPFTPFTMERRYSSTLSYVLHTPFFVILVLRGNDEENQPRAAGAKLLLLDKDLTTLKEFPLASDCDTLVWQDQISSAVITQPKVSKLHCVFPSVLPSRASLLTAYCCPANAADTTNITLTEYVWRSMRGMRASAMTSDGRFLAALDECGMMVRVCTTNPFQEIGSGCSRGIGKAVLSTATVTITYCSLQGNGDTDQGLLVTCMTGSCSIHVFLLDCEGVVLSHFVNKTLSACLTLEMQSGTAASSLIYVMNQPSFLGIISIPPKLKLKAIKDSEHFTAAEMPLPVLFCFKLLQSDGRAKLLPCKQYHRLLGTRISSAGVG